MRGDLTMTRLMSMDATTWVERERDREARRDGIAISITPRRRGTSIARALTHAELPRRRSTSWHGGSHWTEIARVW